MRGREEVVGPTVSDSLSVASSVEGWLRGSSPVVAPEDDDDDGEKEGSNDAEDDDRSRSTPWPCPIVLTQSPTIRCTAEGRLGYSLVGRGGSAVSLVPCVRRVEDSKPTLTATYTDLGQVFHSQLPVALRRVNFDTVSMS